MYFTYIVIRKLYSLQSRVYCKVRATASVDSYVCEVLGRGIRQRCVHSKRKSKRASTFHRPHNRHRVYPFQKVLLLPDAPQIRAAGRQRRDALYKHSPQAATLAILEPAAHDHVSRVSRGAQRVSRPARSAPPHTTASPSRRRPCTPAPHPTALLAGQVTPRGAGATARCHLGALMACLHA